MDKTGKMNMKPWMVVAALAVIYVLVFGVPKFGGTTPTTPPAGGGVIQPGTCQVDKVTFTPQMTRTGKAGTSLSTSANNYFVLTDNIGSIAASSTKEVPTYYDMEVMFGENSTAYYTVVKKLNSDCSNPFYAKVDLALADTSLNTLYVQNADGTVNSVSVPQAMTNDDSFETTVTMKSGTDEYFGNPSSNCQNVGVMEFDKTYFKSATGDKPTAVPGFFTYFNSTYDGAQAFFIPKLASGAKAEFNIKIESTSSDPITGLPVKIHLYDCDVDKNEDTLALIEGVEDEDLNAISLAAQVLNVYIS